MPLETLKDLTFIDTKQRLNAFYFSLTFPFYTNYIKVLLEYKMNLSLRTPGVIKLISSFFTLFLLCSAPLDAADLSNWMRDQAQKVPGFSELPITQIAMPGSHDSLTYNLDKEKRSKGALGFAAKIPLIGKAIVNISKAQGDDLIGQFNNGARYFDVRIALTDKGFEGVHGLYNGPIDKSFQDFKDYLLKHPGEVVILDFQSIDAPNKQELVDLLSKIFGTLIYRPSKGAVNVTYGNLVNSGARVIIFMKGGSVIDSTGTVFERVRNLKSFWHNETDPEKLTESIIAKEEKTPRDLNIIYVIQAQTTPSTASATKSILKSVVTLGFKGGLKDDAKKSLKHQDKLLDRAASNPLFLNAINVFMVDHVNATQAQKIIDLNALKVSAAQAR